MFYVLYLHQLASYTVSPFRSPLDSVEDDSRMVDRPSLVTQVTAYRSGYCSQWDSGALEPSGIRKVSNFFVDLPVWHPARYARYPSPIPTPQKDSLKLSVLVMMDCEVVVSLMQSQRVVCLKGSFSPIPGALRPRRQ